MLDKDLVPVTNRYEIVESRMNSFMHGYVLGIPFAFFYFYYFFFEKKRKSSFFEIEIGSSYYKRMMCLEIVE